MTAEQDRSRSKEANVNFVANFVESGRVALSGREAELLMTGWIPRDLHQLVAQEPLYKGESHLALATVTLRAVAEQIPEFNDLSVVAKIEGDQEPKYYLIKNVDFRFGESVSGEVWRNRTSA